MYSRILKLRTTLYESRMEQLNTNINVHSQNDGKPLNSDTMNRITICEKHLDGTDNKYYSDGAKYWGSVDPSVNGMLGGFGNISNTDIDGSAKFLKGIFKVFIFS